MNTTHFVIMNQMHTTNMINQMNMMHIMNGVQCYWCGSGDYNCWIHSAPLGWRKAHGMAVRQDR